MNALKVYGTKLASAPRWLKLPLYYMMVFGVFMLATYVWYRRFPGNFQIPNFYAEDGKVFANAYLSKGFFGSLLEPFDGYFITGQYLLVGLGDAINRLLFSGSVADLAKSLALASYIFLGFCCTLPLILFRKFFGFGLALALVLVSCYVPLPNYDYAVIGTIGNLKFAFAYIALLLIIYRHYLPEGSKAFYIVDLGLLICAYTNAITYLLVPFALVRYRHTLFSLKSWKRLLKTGSFISLLLLGVLMVPQLIYVAINGIPHLPGYLDTPYRFSRSIELFIARPFLYPFMGIFYPYLTDLSAVAIFIALLALMATFVRGYNFAAWLGVGAVIGITLLFTVKRPGITDHIGGFASSGPDQFFYTQNLIVIFLAGILIREVSLKFKTAYSPLLALVLLSVIIFQIHPSGPNPKTFAAIQTVGSVYSNQKTLCGEENASKTIKAPIYPQGWYWELEKSKYCSPDNAPK